MRPFPFRPVSPKGTCRLNRLSDFLNDSGVWRVNRLREHFWLLDVECIQKIRTSPRLRSDFLSWFLEKSETFTVKNAYKLATYDHNIAHANGASSANPDGNRAIWNRVWKAVVPQKMKITAWRIVTGTLPSQQCKSYRHVATHSTCRLCGVEEETTFHALTTCSQARMLWVNIR